MEPTPESSSDYVLVPREATEAMLRPFYQCPPEQLNLAWQAMLCVVAAAPKPDPVHLAVNRQDAAPGAWVAVDERLPNECTDVLCWWGDHVPMMVGTWGGSCWQDSNGAMDEFDAEPTHWMPLPPAPGSTE